MVAAVSDALLDVSPAAVRHRELASDDLVRWIADLARVKRADDTKVALDHYLREAAVIYWEAGEPAHSLQLSRWAGLLDGCREGRVVRDLNCGGYVLKPQSCDVRLCPDCERARSSRLVDRFDEVAAAMESPRHWTLTLPNVEPGRLREGISVLLDALAHLRRQSIIAGGPCRGAHRAVAYDDVDQAEHHESGQDVAPCGHPPHRRDLAAMGQCRCARCLEVDVISSGYRVTLTGCPRCTHAPVRGGVYSVEITWSREGDWHPHVHVLMDAPWIVHSEFRRAWRAVTCDAIRRAEARRGIGGHGAVKIPRCPHDEDAEGRTVAPCRGASWVWVSDVEGAPGSPQRRQAIREALKYVSKGLLDHEGALLPGARPADLAELLLAIKGRRLVAGWGTFRNVHDDSDEEGPDTVPVYTGDFDRFEQPVVVRMPRLCPLCGAEAAWECQRTTVPRIETRAHSPGVRIWWPPGDSG